MNNPEEKLKEYYKACEPKEPTFDKDGYISILVNNTGGVYIAPEHIDLIVSLVVERLKNAV